jgi:hypothetical protein
MLGKTAGRARALPAANGRANRSTKADILGAPERPPTLPVRPAGIPRELRHRDQWVCWRWQRKRNKAGDLRWTKEPVDAKTGHLASVSNPATWCGFADALAFYRARKADGVGFVFTEADPFCGIDLDDCLDPTTFEVEPWAAEIVEAFQTYAEISPTSTGVKLFARGRVPPGGNRKDDAHVEMYHRRRYFAVTGHRFGRTPSVVGERQQALDRLHARLHARPKRHEANRRPHAPTSRATAAPRADGNDPLRRILSRLEGVTETATGHSACCPAHDDRNPSLSIARGRDGKVLLKCFAGCRPESIVKALGLTMADLFPPEGAKAPGPDEPRAQPPRAKGQAYPTTREAVAALDALMARKEQGEWANSWFYRDAAGQVVALVVRYDLPTPEGEKARKTFRPVSRWPDGWHICDPPGKWPLYRLRDLAGAETVYVVEGERCADALRAAGYVATTSAHGSQAPHKTDWTPLRGKNVYMVPDRDGAGGNYLTQVSRILEEVGQ